MTAIDGEEGIENETLVGFFLKPGQGIPRHVGGVLLWNHPVR